MSEKLSRFARASVCHDSSGAILGIMLKNPSPLAPLAAIAGPPGSKCCEVELDGELARLRLLEIHTKFRVDLTGHLPRLVRK